MPAPRSCWRPRVNAVEPPDEPPAVLRGVNEKDLLPGDHLLGRAVEGENGGLGPELLEAKCAELGLGCDIIPKVEYEGRTVSSTYIRQL